MQQMRHRGETLQGQSPPPRRVDGWRASPSESPPAAAGCAHRAPTARAGSRWRVARRRVPAAPPRWCGRRGEWRLHREHIREPVQCLGHGAGQRARQRRRLDPAGPAQKKLIAQRRAEPGQRIGDGRLGKVQPLRRARHMPLPRHGVEDAQQVEVEPGEFGHGASRSFTLVMILVPSSDWKRRVRRRSSSPSKHPKEIASMLPSQWPPK